MNPAPDLKTFLDDLVARFEHPDFIAPDPIAIPHGFDDPRDQETIGLFAALLAWGRRQTVLDKMEELCDRMSYRPFQFVVDFDPVRDATALSGFKHRTFRSDDAVWLTHNLSVLLRKAGSMERLFSQHMQRDDDTVERALEGFSLSAVSAVAGTPARLSKHLARPGTGSACKRLNMYMRWMVRRGPFDLGIWDSFRTDQLVLPLDVHSGRQARRLGMLSRRGNDWRAAIELTSFCRTLDSSDPCRYDLALFGIGAYEVPVDARLESEATSTSTSSPTER
ncbi:MAG: TIGR02757 family protein [Rhodothermia bacterium]|nr:TIGR02757 family protein [Rhodothermia bacterium]